MKKSCLRKFFLIPLLIIIGVPTLWGQTDITSLSDITDPAGSYRLTSDVSGSGHTSIATFSGTLEAAIDPNTKMPYRITGLNAPLFTTLTGTVKNLVLEDVNISGNTGNTGAIAATANSAARIYNIGILSGSVGGTTNTGGLVGLLGGTAHVVNCYSFATITGGSNVGGIVGNNNTTTTAASINTMVMNCMFYGDITGGSTVSPVFGGTNIANLNNGGLNTFNYYAYDELKTKAISNNKYNSALAVEQKYLNRFEFYRLLLNSNKKLAAFYATGNVADGGLMLKWVLETADRTIDNPKPYPILKAQGKYPSIINPDFEHAPDSSFVGRNHGGKLPSPRNTLTVTISSAQTTGGQTKPEGASITTSSLTLPRTDKDFDRFNYNYDKVQLPYYNDVGTGNYTGNRVVTGWKITAITAVENDPYSSANYDYTKTYASNASYFEYSNYNFADRKSSNKDLYSVSKRVFSQGAYFDVPYGVTSITIEPYWGKAYYIADPNYDVVYKTDYKNDNKQNVTQTGTQVANPTGTTPTMFNGQKVETSIERALNNIAASTSSGGLGGLGPTVYDNALVLVGNLHLATVPQNGTTPFTMMSVDMDNDHEPDYSLIYHHIGRSNITPIRFDFLNIPGTAQAQKPNGASLICNFTIFKTRGWFEITNTALVYSSQLEYENADLGSGVTKIDAPLILLGGIFDQFVSTQSKAVSGKTIYIHVGSNVWIKEFGMGTHSDGSESTPHVPVSVTGGEFPGFYLTGTYNANAKVRSDNAECYISGGYFHEVAGASLEQIDGSVRWQIYNADIDQFFGGGINEAKPIKGDITTDIYNSHVTLFCGGPKFGNMQANKNVTTNAEGCTFGSFFGAGYGGTSITKKKYYDNTTPAWGTTLQGYYTTDRGLYFDGNTTNSRDGGTGNNQYGKKGLGVATDFDYEFFVWTSGSTGGRFYVKFAAFSLAQCNDVSSTLKKCTVNENFYGGGSLGKVVGTATSVLEDCTVHGSAYGGGYSASLPTVEVRDAGFTKVPNYNKNSGMFEPAELSGTTTFTWQNAAAAGKTLTDGQSGSDLTNHVLYTNADLTTLGEVAHTNLTIKGTTTVGESVYGGGEESAVGGNTEVNVQGGTIGTGGLGGADYGNVYGGGKGKDDDVTAGLVKGNTAVNISSLPDNNKTKVLHNVYGGGAYGSVGTFTYDDSNTITGYTSGGQATVNIVGGTFGTDGHDNGMVFGSSRGKDGNPLTDTNIDKLAWVYNTVVNVGTAGSATGPMVNGSVYGGGENGHNYQNAAVNIHSGTIGYTSYDPTSGYNCGSVFGAGCGTDKYTVGEVQHYNPLAGTVWGNTTIAIDGGHIRHNVYGGGAIGSAGKADGSNGKATITVTGGRVGTDGNDNGNIYGAPRGDSEATDADIAQVVDTEVNINYATTPTGDNTEHTAQLIAGSVFGGGQSGVVRHSVVVNMKGGLVLRDLYGGSALANTNIGNATNYGTSSEAISSTSTYTTTLNLHGGIVGHNVYGGGLGRKAATGVAPVAALVYGDVMVKLNETIATDNCIVKGKIFGCNNYNGTPKGIPTVHVYKTVGYDDSHNKSTDKDDTTYDLQAVYGGGNEAAYQPALSTSSTNVIIDGCDLTSIQYVYGGGNAAPAPATQVTVNSCYEIGSLFGGGNGYDDLEDGSPNPGADVGLINGSPYGSGDANTLLYGGKVHEAYGASNFKGTIRGSINLDVHDGGVCALEVDKVVGAGKNADIDGDVIVVMGCMPTTETPLVFGGADNANVNGNVELTITSGTFGQIFGGNNLGGVIKGHIKVNIEETGCNPIKIDELYLGGNQAAYSVFGYYDSGETLSNGKVKYLPRTSGTDSHTAIENPSNADNKHPFPYAQPVLNVISCTSIDSVFGGGLGAGAFMYANPTVNINMVPGSFANNTSVGVPATMTELGLDASDNPNNLGVLGDVYGGGNEAAVYGNTKVNIGTLVGQPITLTSTGDTPNVVGAFISGTVYGAGRGLATDPNAAIVTGNTQVNMAGGKVCRSIYGGGELSSVGTFDTLYTVSVGDTIDADYHVIGEPKTCVANTGLTEVIVSGGQVGLVNQLMPDPSRPTSDDDYGYIFCAGKGMADPTNKNSDGVSYANLLAICGSSHLVISDDALVAASVYGGSENGQVLGDTHVEIKGGQIGSGHKIEGDVHSWDPAYTEAQWTAAINAIKSGVVGDINTAVAPFHQCDAWPFGPEGSRYVYDHFAEYLYNGEYYYDAAHTQSAHGGSKSGTDGHSYYGNVFGGGSGYYPWAAGKWRRTAGRVNGNTLVEITGGHILTNVYGGNEITDVLGQSKVVMKAGTVGVPRTMDSIQARPVNSYIFGAGMGDPRVLFNGWSNVASAEVIVDSVAVVFGSVFGGGEDGHVLGDVSTTIKGDALIGTFGSSGVDGNIFGSGRGFSTLALTAGAVCGNVTVNVAERAKILGSIFGGGRMAAVGTYLAAEGTANYGKLIAEGDDPYGTGSTTHGNVTINITGGTIGNLSLLNSSEYSIGDVFGGSKGVYLNGEWTKSQKLGLVKNTTVNISQTSASSPTIIYGNVYGGGEIASVGSYTYAEASDTTSYNPLHPSEPMAIGDVYSLLEAGTGLAKILITGGTIGQNTTTDTKGNVFGGCLGMAGTAFSGYSFVNNSDITLQGDTVYGSIFGGGENGHVFSDTDVKIKSGSVGIRLDNVADSVLNNNMIYRGNVYGGGRGTDKTTGGKYSITAGKVNGNTNVTVTGGTIYRNVYGGGSLASVGILDVEDDTNGNATVTIKGGQIGTDGGASANNYNTLIPDREVRRENGFVFGSGRGMAAGNTNPELARLAYTKNTIVNIDSVANVTGSVFGGGENGHVKFNTKVYVKGNSFVGTELIDAEHNEDKNGRGRLLYRGNVYGGGRGIDTGDAGYSLTAGRVYGDTYVEVSGGKIYHDVFGGGSLASVGNETVNPSTGEVSYGDESGETEVRIKGGIIGYSSTASKQGFNCGFVYGGCRGLSAEPTSEAIKMAYVHDTRVYIDSVAQVKGSVFGGGANGHVKNNTYVEISGGEVGTALLADEVGFDDHGVAVKPVFRGNVYAGGRGVDQFMNSDSTEVYSLSAGAVYGNAQLLMTGGHVWHNIYGSGAMASVGTIKSKPSDMHVHDEIVDIHDVVLNPDTVLNYLTGVFEDSTGIVRVTITGGTVGDTTHDHEGQNNGNVYGAGRGVSADRSDYVASMEYVNKTYVTIGTEGQKPSDYSGSAPGELNYPYIYGAVFGGGENGHVKTDTDVKVHSGIIGWPLVEGTDKLYTTNADGSTKNPYLGNLFGGGRGVDPVHHKTGEERSSSAGRVYGHTNVTMTGGVVRRAIYGGGLLASVGVYQLLNTDMHIINMIEDNEDAIDAGDARVTITGGYVGNVNPDGTALGSGYLVPGDNNGHVFGSSCGMVADDYVVGQDSVDIQYRQMGYTHSTHVSISGDSTQVFGCVFGSGENGHVWEDSRIDIRGGQIGSDPAVISRPDSTTIYIGNVYGSGRGVDHPHKHISETAGKVRGNTSVNVAAGTVWRDVYGGGSLASVGEADEQANTGLNPDIYPFPYKTGLTRVTIDSVSVVRGSVYGSGRGVASTDTLYKQAAYVKNTIVTVKGNSHVYENVFGGGNAGHVRKDTDVTIDGSAKVDGNVYGGGAGDISSSTAGLVDHDVTVNIKGGLIAHDVYGGGAIANTNVHDVRNTAITSADCNETRGNAKTKVNLIGGIILGDAYGGGQGVIPPSGATPAEIANAGALVQGDVTVTLNGTAFYPTTKKDDQNNDIAASGRVFGCNNLNGTPQGTVFVNVMKTVGLTASGGTYTVNATKPTKGTDTYEVQAVYGGGNLAAYVPWDGNATGQYTEAVAANNPLQVLIDGCNLTSIEYVYGGGNAASVSSSQVVVKGAHEIGSVFGGGNGKDRISNDGLIYTANPGAHVGLMAYPNKAGDAYSTKAERAANYGYGTGKAHVIVYGGTVHEVYGGSNTKGNVRVEARATLEDQEQCDFNLDEAYGGGRNAEMDGDAVLEVGCIKGLGRAYGGAANADVNGDVVLNITNGTYGQVFGGNDMGGNISGSITVNIEETGCRPIIIGELYGGGNEAAYTAPTGSNSPVVNVKSFTSIGTIFGGGFGAAAVITGNPEVNINVVTGKYRETVVGEGARVVGSSLTNPSDEGYDATAGYSIPAHQAGTIGNIGTVFGGGNAARVVGNTNVNVGTHVDEEVYDVVTVATGASVTSYYTRSGDTYTAATGTAVEGTTYYEKKKVAVRIVGNVFGGGNKAEVTGNTNVVVGK